MSALPSLPPPKPIPIKERASVVFVERGEVDRRDGAFVVVDATGERLHIPVGGVACLMLEPGARISHAAVSLASQAGTLLVWVGEAGVRVYAAGQPGGARADRLLWQARLALDDAARLRVVRRMFALRFGEEAPEKRSVDQLRGIEGARVRALYKAMGQQYGVAWRGRRYDRAVRLGCRDAFRRTKLLDRLIPLMEEMLEAGALPRPEAPADAQPPQWQTASDDDDDDDPGRRPD